MLFDGVYSYSYDPEGNRTARFIDVNANGLLDAGDTAATTYAWDHRNRLTCVTDYDLYGDPATRAVDYLYDTENRWIGRDVDLDADGQIDTRTRFAYDGNQIVLQFDRALATADNPADPLTEEHLSHRYLWNPAAVDQLMADEQVTAPDVAGDILWPLADHLGTIRDLAAYDSSTAATTVVNHRTFDAYGNLQSQTSTNPAHDTLFAYTGRPLDQETSLQNNLHRWYDPAVGRWMTEDTIGFEGRDGNLCAYVGNGPVNGLDPSGCLEGPEWEIMREKDRAREAREREVGKTRTIDFKGSAWDLWKLWWSLRNLKIVWDINITGDTPFTLEARQMYDVYWARVTAMGAAAALDSLPQYDCPREGKFKCQRDYSDQFARAAYDIYFMFVGAYLHGDNIADVFLGSYMGRWEIISLNKEKKTAIVKFTIENSTNWKSATGGLYGKYDGAVFEMTVTWTEEIYYGPPR